MSWTIGRIVLAALGAAGIGVIGRTIWNAVRPKPAPGADQVDEDGCSLKYYPSPNQSAGARPMPPKWIVIHDTEGGTTAEQTARYFMNPAAKAASHLIVDDAGNCFRSVADDRTAWHVGAGNPQSLGIELVAPAGAYQRSRQGWLEHDRLLDAAADHVMKWCARYKIPVQFIDAAGLKRGDRGITTHAEMTKGIGGTTHIDPGPGFPMDDFIKRVSRRMPIV